MLTESEKKWLRNRKGKDDLYLFCKHCTAKIDDCYWNHVVGACPMYPDIEDAAEFEGRVAARLARMMLRPNEYKYPCRNGVPELGCMRDMTALTGSYAVHCIDCILREVRLQVEKGMDNDEERKRVD